MQQKINNLIDKFEKETGFGFYTISIDSGEEYYPLEFLEWVIKKQDDLMEDIEHYCKANPTSRFRSIFYNRIKNI